MIKITESYIQQQCYMWLTNSHGLKHHEPRLLMFSIPNEIAMAIRSVLIELKLPVRLVDQAIAIALKKVKNTGFLPGVSDTVVCCNGGVSLYIEFKTPTGTQSSEQKEFQERVQMLGHSYYLCRSLEEFKQIIQNHA